MKTIILFGAAAFGLLFNSSLQAQVSLPYTTGFDNATEQNGWVEYKTAATQFSHWSINTGAAFTAPNSIGHDYSPSTGITLTDNWYVSPGFNISNGGMLDSIRFKFTGLSTPIAGDTLGIYILQGASDPAQATNKVLIHDFRGADYVTSSSFEKLENLSLPSFNGLSYLAIRYRNSNCSSHWLTVGYDNISISGSPTSTIDNGALEQVKIYPNPSAEQVTIEGKSEISQVIVYNQLGQQMDVLVLSGTRAQLDVSEYSKGVYSLLLVSNEGTSTRKIMVE